MKTNRLWRIISIFVIVGILVIPLSLLAKEVAADPSQRLIVVLKYYEYGVGDLPLKNAKYELRTSTGTLVSTTYANNNGVANFYPATSGNYQIWAYTEDAGTSRLLNYNAQGYPSFHFSTPTFYYNKATGYTEAYTFIGYYGTQHSHLWAVYVALIDARAYALRINPGFTPRPLDAYYPRESHFCWTWDHLLNNFDWMNCGNDIANDLLTRTETFHEYGHHLMWDGRSKDTAIFELGGVTYPHQYKTEAKPHSQMDPAQALIEGWAEFFEASAAQYYHCWYVSVFQSIEAGGMTYVNPGPYTSGSVYADQGEDSTDFDGFDVEGAVMAALWDCNDTNNSGDYPSVSWNTQPSPKGDFISRGFVVIWHNLMTHKANNMWEFYTNWITNNPNEPIYHFSGDSIYLKKIFFNQRMDLDHPLADT